MLFSKALIRLTAVLPFAAAIPYQGLSIRDNPDNDCELGGAAPVDGDAGKTPNCKDCKTVGGIPAPKATPTGVPGNQVSGDPDISNTKHKRAPEAVPLITTNDIETVDGQPDEVSLFDLILGMTPDGVDNDIDITPSDEQIATWQIDGNPIGATGKWYPFGNTPQTWKMRGLSGCTAIFIVSSNGLWAGHLWESSGETKINGGSSFKKRLSATDVVVRPLDEFKKIAVDIMTQETPADQVANRQHWLSLKDLETKKGNPFANGEDVDIFVLTRANSATSKAMKYSQQINALKRTLVSATNNPPRGNFAALTYPGKGDTSKLKYPGTNGKIVIQYTPFHGLDTADNCKRMAGVQIWANPETQKAPVIWKLWEALSGQQVAKRAACNAGPTTTPPPTSTPSCTMQNQDPDQGINTEYCVCDGSRTLPFLTISPTVVRTKSCDYTTLPPKGTKRDALPTVTARSPAAVNAMVTPTVTPSPTLNQRDLTISTGFGPPTTDMKHCQVCTRVVNNEDSCSSIKDCVVQTGAVTLEAGTSSVHVGTVTGTALYTSVSSALAKICPTPSNGAFTGCSQDSAVIGKVPYEEGGFLATDGELVVTVESSKYNDTNILQALIKTAATAAQQAATGKNCYKATYEVEMMKRSEEPWWLPRMFRRDHPHPVQESNTWCNTVGFAGPHYYNPWWRIQSQPGATDYIDAHWEFHKGASGSFDCMILQDLVEAFAFIQPEFAIGDIGLGEAIDIACEAAAQSKRDLDNSTLIEAI